MIKINAIQIKQNNRVFYIAALLAGDLVRITKVDIWQQGEEDPGYQRAPSETRMRNIGRYVMSHNAIMPVGGLLNARINVKNESNSFGTMLSFNEQSSNGDIKFGELTIPDEANPLYIVDMQHRLGGFQWALSQPGGEILKNFPLVVTIADGLTKLEEIDQFDLINTTQKKVRTDLARRLKSIQAQDLDHHEQLEATGKLWEAKGALVADWLNTHSGVWYGKIIPPNKSKSEMPFAVMRETSFVESLKPILITPYFAMRSEEHAANLIDRYWEAIRNVFPEAFESPDDYVIQKTPGVFSLHSIANFVFEVAKQKGEISTEKIQEIISPMQKIEGGSFFWKSENDNGASQYGSQKGFKLLTIRLRKLLPGLTIGE
jgi:DGQHR domain-containing protein